jgi:hypothetical protein
LAGGISELGFQLHFPLVSVTVAYLEGNQEILSRVNGIGYGSRYLTTLKTKNKYDVNRHNAYSK